MKISTTQLTIIQNSDSKPEQVSLDEACATILQFGLSEHKYRNLTEQVNTKVKGLNWELEKFRVC